VLARRDHKSLIFSKLYDLMPSTTAG
jgi:hypothetical protein